MVYFLIKVLISALIIAGVSELGKRSSGVAAILASLPLTSILAILWLYRDTQDITKIVDLSNGIFWAILPSLLFFIVLPLLLKMKWGFGWAMVSSSVMMVAAYLVYIWGLGKFGIRLR